MDQNGWQRIWARRYTPYVASCYVQVMQRIPGFDTCRNKLFVPEGGLHALYFRADEFKQLVDNYSAYLLKINIANYSREYEQTFADYLAWAREANKRDWSKLSANELSVFLVEFTNKNIDFADSQFLAFVVLEGIAREVEEHYVDVLTREAIGSTEKLTAITQARIELLTLSEHGIYDDESLENYLNRYAWLPMYEFIDEPMTVEQLKNQLTDIDSPRAERVAIEQIHAELLARYRAELARIDDPVWRKKVEITHAFSYLKEMRDDYRRPYYLAFRPFWNEVARRTELRMIETNYLLTEELVNALRHNMSYHNQINKRLRVFSLVLRDGALEIIDRDVSPEYFGATQIISHEDEIKGMPVSVGCARGRVRIIYHKGDFSKFSEGEILVTVMTHPEFLPLMKKAAAIVTDEGGITCHAAIVARELQKPCIIGTKNATRILRDGDLVEVDVEHGIVRKM